MQFCAVHIIAQLLWLLAIPLLSAVCQLPFMFTTPYCTRLKCAPYSECAWFEAEFCKCQDFKTQLLENS